MYPPYTRFRTKVMGLTEQTTAFSTLFPTLQKIIQFECRQTLWMRARFSRAQFLSSIKVQIFISFTNLSFSASWYYFMAAISGRYGRHSVAMGIVDNVPKFSAFR